MRRPLSSHRPHALRVAAVATLIVMVCYVIAALVLNVLVSHHLFGNIDARLHDRLEDVRQRTLQLPGTSSSNVDADDVPIFVWSTTPSGVVTSLTPGGPALPNHPWNPGTVTLPAGGSTFRFDAIRNGDATLVAGQSLASTANTKSTLVVAELVFGVILAVAVFVGSTIIGLRASAPSELVRRRQAEFTADASHELRTPISVIEAEVDLALDRPRDPVAYRETLERVGQESSRLRRIVEDLLWLARADDDQRVRSPSSDVTDVARVAAACGQRFGALAASSGVDLSVQRVGTGPFTVQAPSALIDRLVGVLVDNACKFAGRGGRVEVTVRSAGARVDLRVDDSGPGIPEGERDAVFDRFHRTDDAVAGTGLGLAIADSIVRATQGTWHIGTAELGGARMGISWRRATPKKGRPPAEGAETLSKSLA